MGNTDTLDEVFKRFESVSQIFRDREVLRHDYLPLSLPHREEQICLLAEIVAPVLKGARSSNIFIYGKTGTGKTAVTKHVLTRLELKSKELGAAVRFSYVNCRMASSEYRVFACLCQSLGISVPFTGLSVGEVFDRFRISLQASRTLFIIILDEIDALLKGRGDAFLYELTRVNETLEGSKVSLIGISNDLRMKEYLDPRVLSSLSEEEIVFRPYDAAELRNILQERASVAFFDGVLPDGTLGLCAALAAAEHGDARRALDLLRVAGEVGERQGSTIISEDHVREAEKHIEHNRIAEAVQNLTLHSKLVLLGVFHVNRLGVQSAATGEIFDVYGELCGELGIPALTQRRLCSLVNELDAMGLLNSKVVSMGRYGRTKKIRLELARTTVKEVFARDARLASLTEYEPTSVEKRSYRS